MEDQRKGLLLLACVSCVVLASIVGGASGDVPDGVVYTDLHKTVKSGNEIVLTCEFYKAPIAVYWKKGDDPDGGTDLITWVYEEEISGSCVNNEACNMTDDYSLVIGNARIADQGRYICRVSNYLGILIHNYTDVKIIAPPKKPYPVIEECAEKESSGFDSTNPCKILTNTTIIVTCSAMNYYPDLDLFFLHGSQKMTDITTSESTNIDETKNKSISIKASTSETPYVCVASGIPGSKDQTAATIFVESSTVIQTTRENEKPPTPSTSNTVTTEKSTGNNAAKIVLPIIIIILVIGAVVVCVFLWWKSPRLFRRIITGGCGTGINSSTTSEPDDKIEMTAKETTADSQSATTSVSGERVPLVEKATIAGKISFYELWSLAYDTPSSDMKKVHHVLVNLGIKDVHEGLTAPDIYDLLCKWKDNNKKGQHALLQSAMKSADIESRWVQLCEQRRYVGVKIPGATLEQIILDIESQNKIEHFLRNLLPGQYIKIKGDPIEKAMKLLRKWRNSSFKENPFALLSLALERCGCSPVARTFFAGTVSFFELWSLSRMMAGSDVKKIRNTLENLQLLLEDDLSADDVYRHLCCWKEADKTSYQGKSLRDAFERADIKEAWKGISEFREKSCTQVSENTLEHVLWHIRDPTKIDDFLHKMTLDRPHARLDINSELKEIIKEAMGHLKTWTKQRRDENPVILMSHALEKTGCSPVDRSFFTVPNEQIANIAEAEVQGFVHILTIRHINKLKQCLGIGNNEVTMSVINDANKDTIFNTESMLTEWIIQEGCTNYEKRLRLNEAVATIGRQDLKDHFGTTRLNPEINLSVEKGTISTVPPGGCTMKEADVHLSKFSDDEFKRIGTYLSQSKVKEMFGDGHAGDEPFDVIRAFAEGSMAKHPKQDFREKLHKKLEPAGFKALIPYMLKSNVYLCELVDVAFRLLLDDVYPLAKALGISDMEIKKYTVEYVPDHLTKGTTAALIEFSESNQNDRGIVCQAISKAGYKKIALLLEYGHETSLADEYAVAAAVAGDKEGALAKISHNLRVRDTSNIETVLKDWKTMVHPPSYNHRKSLADAVFPVVGADVAVSILSGKYREDGSNSSQVIQTISTTIESFELSLLKKILGEKDSKKSHDEQVTTQSQGTQPLGESGEVLTDIHKQYISSIALKLSQILGVAIKQHSSAHANPVIQVLETWEEKISKKKLSKDGRRQLSDNLLRAGFKQFAFEIMTGFVSRPKALLRKLKKEGKQDQKSMKGEQTEQSKQEKDTDPVNQNTAEQEDVDVIEETVNDKSRHKDQGTKDNDAQTSEESDEGNDEYDSEESDEPENEGNNEQASENNEDQANTAANNEQSVDEQPIQEEQLSLIS